MDGHFHTPGILAQAPVFAHLTHMMSMDIKEELLDFTGKGRVYQATLPFLFLVITVFTRAPLASELSMSCMLPQLRHCLYVPYISRLMCMSPLQRGHAL